MLKIKTSHDEIKLISQITEEDKGDFIEMTEHDLLDMFGELKTPDEKTLPEELNYEICGVGYYKKKFPGFSDEEYKIFVDCDKKINDTDYTDNENTPVPFISNDSKVV